MSLTAALIGCGAMSRAWLTAIEKLDGLKVVGLADIEAARAKQRASEFRLTDAIVASTIEDLLAEAKPDLLFDVVVPAARHRVVATALGAGCHVLSEKPMAETMDEARDLVARATQAGRIHAVIQNRRYLGSVRRIARAVRSQLFGTVTSVHADFFLAPHFGGFREDMDHVLLLDMAIHAFDAMRCMTGIPVRGVYAREWDPPNSWYRHGSSATAVFDLDNGGAFTYRGSWCAEGLGTSWECAWRIIGTRGTLVWDGRENIQIEVGSGQRNGLFDGTAEVAVPALDLADRIGGHFGVLQDFVAAVRDGKEPETSGNDNIRSLAMSLGAIQSAQTGRRIDILN